MEPDVGERRWGLTSRDACQAPRTSPTEPPPRALGETPHREAPPSPFQQGEKVTDFLVTVTFWLFIPEKAWHKLTANSGIKQTGINQATVF